MKTPLVIGLLSIFPGLGFIILSKPIIGINVFLVTAFLIFLGITIQNEDVSNASFALALIAWGSQIYYAVLIAQHLKRTERISTPAVRTVSITPPAQSASRGEMRLYNAKQEVMQLLPPGEYVSVALYGEIGAPLGIAFILNIILTLLSGSPVDKFKEGQTVYLAITAQDFILIETDILGKPKDLQRIHLSQVRLTKFTEGILFDKLIIDTGKVQALVVRVGRQMRQGTRELARRLPVMPSAPQPGSPARQAALQPSGAEKAHPESNTSASVQTRGSIKSRALIRHTSISAVYMFIGYSAVYGILISGIISIEILEDPFVKDVMGNILVQICVCLPILLPASFVLAALVLLVQSRLRLTEQVTQTVNIIASTIIGSAAFIPYQFVVVVGAAF